jgi:hypothetical protein
MKNRIYYLIIFLAATSILVSCEKDDDNDDNNIIDPAYTFLDQVLQGEIEGEAWMLKAGSANESWSDSTSLYVEMFAMESDNPCSDFDLDGNRVIFHVPFAPGLYELILDWTEDSQTITLFHDESGMNTVATKGAVEIISIDEVNGVMEGRIAAEADVGNFVNGNFTINFCN